MNLDEELDYLREKLRDTQDRVMALEGEMRVLAACLHEGKALPFGLFEMRLHQAIQELHGGHPDEFPEVVRSMIVLRDFCEALRKNEPPQ
ncbi:MAG: hypothetical protein K2X78_02860 [Burkholderiaceae bacterium]|nr:hypothetical protein [Burkholderiaceae bacterium]